MEGKVAENSIGDSTSIFEMDGLNSSLMGMLPGHQDGLRRYYIFKIANLEASSLVK